MRRVGSKTRRLLLSRLPVLMDALGATAAPSMGALRGIIGSASREELWLTAAVLTATLPEGGLVRRLRRLQDLGDLNDALAVLLESVAEAKAPGRRVEVLIGVPVLDLHGSLTGRRIGDSEEVARTLTSHAPADVVQVRWTAEHDALVRLDAEDDQAVLVPWKSSYLVPDLVDQVDRAARAHTLFVFSGNRCFGVGYGVGPLTFSELFPEHGLEKEVSSPRYSWNMAVLRASAGVLAVSATAEAELRGWFAMLNALGVEGPPIHLEPLGLEPADVPNASADGPLRVLVLGRDAAGADLPTVVAALDRLAADGVEVVAHLGDPGAEPSLAQHPAFIADDREGDEPVDAVIHMAPYSTHSLGLDRAIAAGIPAVVAETGYGLEWRGRTGVRAVPMHDEVGLAEAIGSLARARGQERPVHPGFRSPAEYARSVWSIVTS